MEFKYISPKYKNSWEKLVKVNSSSGYMQSFWWNEFLNYLGWETFKIGIFEDKKLIGGAIVSKFSGYKNFNYLQIIHGPIVSSKRMFDQLMEEIDKVANLSGNKLSSHISIEPKLISIPKYFNRFIKAKTDQEPTKTLLIDLTKSESKLLSEMKPKGRYNIKIAEKNGVEIFETDFKIGFSDFIKIYNQFTKRMKFEGKKESYFDRLAFVLNQRVPHQLYFAKYNGKTLAAALVIYYGDTATYLYGASNTIDRHVMAPYLLHWQIIKDAKKSGFKKYDFMGLNPEGTGSEHPWYGFSEFKRKFGGNVTNYIGAYDFVYNEKIYLEFEKTGNFRK